MSKLKAKFTEFQTKVTHLVSDRISSSWSNTHKKQQLILHFNQVKIIKNLMSQFVFSNLDQLDYEFKKTGYQQFKQTLPAELTQVLTAWETQKLLNDVVVLHTQNYLEKVIKNSIFFIAKIKTSRGKNYNHKQTTPFTQLLNYLRLQPVFDEEKLPGKIKSAWVFYSKKFGQERLLALVKLHQLNVISSLNPVNYNTGSYIKAAQFNKNSVKPTWHSRWIRDESNVKFQDWYVLKTPEFEVYLPLSVNYKYHNKDYDLRKEHWIKLNSKNEINLSLTYDRTDLFTEKNYSKIVGLDLNVKHNLLASSTGLMFKLQEDWVKNHQAKLENLEKKGYKNLAQSDKTYLLNLVKHREATLRNKIQEMLNLYKEQGITDIVLENLTLTLGNCGSKSQNKLLRMLRFGTIREWIRQQGHKFGIRVHDLPSAYSSQACECGNVSENNRLTQENFECKRCGIEENADIHAGKNLLRLFATSRDVLVGCGYLLINQFGEYTSKQNLGHKKIKVFYELLAKDLVKFPIQGGILSLNTIPVIYGVGLLLKI